MNIKGLAISMGIGAAAGAVAILMMPRNNATRKLAEKAADKAEDAVTLVSNKVEKTLNL